MSRLIVTEFMTLDGVMEAPGGEPTHPHAGWVMEYFGPEQNDYKLAETLEAGSLLIGRDTYETFAASWPTYDGEFADKMNSMPKYVVSSTLSEPLAGTTRSWSAPISWRRCAVSRQRRGGRSSSPGARRSSGH